MGPLQPPLRVTDSTMWLPTGQVLLKVKGGRQRALAFLIPGCSAGPLSPLPSLVLGFGKVILKAEGSLVFAVLIAEVAFPCWAREDPQRTTRTVRTAAAV